MAISLQLFPYISRARYSRYTLLSRLSSTIKCLFDLRHGIFLISHVTASLHHIGTKAVIRLNRLFRDIMEVSKMDEDRFMSLLSLPM